MKIVIKGHFIEHIFFKFQCYFNLSWELSDNTCISCAGPVLTGAVFLPFLKKICDSQLHSLELCTFLESTEQRCVVPLDLICVLVSRRGGDVKCCTVYGHLGDWRLRQALLVLCCWRTGPSATVYVVVQGEEETLLSLSPPISLSLWLCFFLL